MERLNRIVGLLASLMPGIMTATAIVFVIGMTGCATAPRGSFCDIADPIRLSDRAIDALSDAEVERALAHNRKGAELCDWSP